MKPTPSLPYAYELSTRPCSEPDKSTSLPHVLFIHIPRSVMGSYPCA